MTRNCRWEGRARNCGLDRGRGWRRGTRLSVPLTTTKPPSTHSEVVLYFSHPAVCAHAPHEASPRQPAMRRDVHQRNCSAIKTTEPSLKGHKLAQSALWFIRWFSCYSLAVGVTRGAARLSVRHTLGKPRVSAQSAANTVNRNPEQVDKCIAVSNEVTLPAELVIK